VVAVDDRVDAALMESYAAVADRILRFPYADPPERVQPWLHGQCRGQWVLRLDADEVPGLDLADAVADVIARRDLTHGWVRRRWLFPDSSAYLAQWPWQPDYQLRLIRRDPAVARVTGAMHGYAEAVGACAYLEPPLYHADLLVNDERARLAKVARYRDVRPDLHIAGRELNEAYYLPERWSDRSTLPVPAQDLPAVQALLDPPPVASRAPSVSVARAGRAEIDAAWDAAPLAPDAYAAHLHLLEGDLRVFAGEARTFDVLVTNAGGRRWLWGTTGQPEIRLAQRWHRNGLAPLEGLRTPLPHTIEPGGTCLVPAQVAAPPDTGSWTLEIDLVHEHVRWFGCAVLAEVTCVAH